MVSMYLLIRLFLNFLRNATILKGLLIHHPVPKQRNVQNFQFLKKREKIVTEELIG